ncbi:MAG: D-TA family PLP-dependent enzyme [Verrucomicrobiota bacterium]
MNDECPMLNWFTIANLEDIESPALLIYPDRVEENIRRMIAVAGDPAKLQPHVKTHKLAQVTAMQINAGITKFKAATITEAEMCARAGADEVLLAYQPVGPNIGRFLELIRAFWKTVFACLTDNLESAQALSQSAAGCGIKINVLLDLDCGQHRTGLTPDGKAIELYQALGRLPGVNPAGLHAYDGHVHTSDPALRRDECEAAFAPVAKLRDQLASLGVPAKTVVAGGTPTFPFHARRTDVECSPGTCVLWDFGYNSRFPDLDFLYSALVLARVISKPGNGRLCLDLGHKAVAAENPPPRVYFLNLPSARFIAHSEEHLVIETDAAGDWKVGDCLYGVPWHICPTVALHGEAVVIQQGRAVTHWRIQARERHVEF